MKRHLYILLLFLPFAISAQVEEEHEVMMDVPVEEISPREDFLRSIPASRKDGKPHVHQYNKLMGYFLNDSILIPFIYEELDYQYSDFMICREPRKLYGVINKKGETVIPFEYVSLKRYFDVFFAWKKNAGYGIMTLSGKEIVPFEYQKGAFGADTTLVFMSPGKQLVVKPAGSDRVQMVLESSYDEMSIEPAYPQPLLAVQQQGRWGVLNYQNQLAVPCEYDKIQKVFGQHVIAVKTGKMGVVNVSNAAEIPFEYETIDQRLRNGLFRFGKTGTSGKKLWGLLDSTGRVVLPAEYQQIEQFYECDLMKIQKAGLYGVADPTGKIRLAPQFNEISAWEHNIYTEQKDPLGKTRKMSKSARGLYFWCKNKARQSSLWHLDKGQIIAPGDYEYFRIYHDAGVVVVTRQEKNAVLNMNGKQLIGYEYGNLSFSSNHPEFVTSSTNGKRTLISMRTGKQVQPEYYDDWFFNYVDEKNGYFYTKIGDFTALHAPDGRRITPHKYWGGITPCENIPEMEARLPKNRKIVACGKTKNEYEIHFYAIDDAGAEYEYNRK